MTFLHSGKPSFQKICLLLLTCFIACSVSAQRLDTLMDMYNSKYPGERIHLQFDKSSYAPKDDIWFKAYIMSGILPDNNLSKNLYVDFSDEKGKVLAHDVFPIGSGVSAGQFKVPDSLQGNLLHVRAYTKWMLNFDTSFLYNKNLTIIQTRAKRIKGKPPIAVPVLHFFPEGGDAVAGLKTKIAFMCEDQYGQPVKITGTVKDASGNEVTKLEVQHDGMGSFDFLPSDNQKYIATWKDDKGNTHTTPLPEIKSTGIALNVHSSANSKVFEIQRQDDAADNFKSLHVVATMYQEVVYMANVSLADKIAISGTIPTTSLPSGIVQITVFDKDWKPLAERIAFVKGAGDNFSAEVGFAKLNFNTRGQNELIVDVEDSIPANLSVAVTDAALSADSSNNVISDMFLSSQIKGHVNKPYYYFSDTTEQVNKDLDLVMLTHGWRRFDWEKVLNKQPLDIKYPMDSSYLTFSGKIFGATPQQLAAAGMMLAFVSSKTDTTRKMEWVTLNPDGTFNDPNAIFFDSLNVYYKFAGKHDYLSNAKVNFMPGRLLSPGKVPLDENDIIRARNYDTTGLAAGETLYDKYWASAHFNEDTANINTVVVNGHVKTKEEKLDDEYTSGLFKGGMNGRVFDIEDDISAQGQMNILAYLQGRVAGLQISNPMSSNPSMTWRGSTPALYIDEIPQQDASMLTSMSMADIAMVKVFSPPFMGAFGGGAGGAIAVYTKKGSDVTNNDGKPTMPKKEIIGYTAIRQFYTPNYLSLAEDHDKVDVRQTLYWNPLIVTTPQQHELKFQFFNNDITHAYRIILEGMNNNGQLVHIEKVVQ